ncbi:MAG: sulfatase [Candidatus Eiseniibacteriota bacterium]
MLAVVAAWLLRDTDRRPLRNVVLIVIDTCRADHMSLYGYARSTTPHIDSLAARGVRFDRAHAQAPWTLPSFASLFTSQYPSEHRAGGRFGDFRRFDTATRTLAEELLDHGIATAGIANVTWLEPKFRFSKGFQIYDYRTTDATNTGHRTAEATTAAALAAVDRMPEPFFLMAHYFDPHVRYEPPAPFDTLFTGDYDGPYGKGFGNTDQVVALRNGTLELDAAARRHLAALYDGEIAFTDAQIGVLLAELRRRGIAGRTLVVVTADHGEEFWDHGGFEHGHSLKEHQIHVPLVWSGAGVEAAGTVVEQPVESIDIAPTILDLLGLEPPLGFRGASLQPWLEGRVPGEAAAAEPVVFSEAVLWGDARQSLIAGHHKLIVNLEQHTQELFDLAADPGERRDLAVVAPDRVETLRARLLAVRPRTAAGREAETVDLDPDMLERLKALGYTR